jgi:hypothetical protein
MLRNESVKCETEYVCVWSAVFLGSLHVKFADYIFQKHATLLIHSYLNSEQSAMLHELCE